MQDSFFLLCAKVLCGEASPEEAAELEALKAASPEHRAEFDSMRQLWLSLPEPDSVSFDTSAAWDRVAAATGIAAPVAPKRIALRWLPVGIAAAAVLGFFLLRPLFAPNEISIVASANTEVTLPDGSHVSLRQGGRLSYPKAFDAKERDVTLRGEAFFQVTRNERQPFVVHADQVNVQVLGTSFDVHAEKRGATVSVASGKVRVSSAAHPATEVILQKGEQASLVDDHLSRNSLTSDNYLYWKTGKLNFRDQPLQSVIHDLSAASGKHIRLESALQAAGAQKVTIGFENESLEEMLTELGMITHTSWKADKEGYIIRAL